MGALANSKALVELCEDDIVWKGDWVECMLHSFEFAIIYLCEMYLHAWR